MAAVVGVFLGNCHLHNLYEFERRTVFTVASLGGTVQRQKLAFTLIYFSDILTVQRKKADNLT